MAIKKLAIDLGNSTIEISGKAGDKEDSKVLNAYIPSAYDIRAGNITYTPGKGATIECLGSTIFLGEGIPMVAVDKTDRQYFEHQVLYGAWRLFGAGSHVIKLAVGLPIKTYKLFGTSYQERLNEIVKIEGFVNGEKVSLNVDSVLVCAEGYSSLFSLEESISQMAPTLIVDIGYKTTDALSVRWDEEAQQYIPEIFDSFNIGLYDMLNLMSERLLKEGADMTPEELNKCLNSTNSMVRTRTGSGVLNIKSSLHLVEDKCKELVRSLELKYGQLLQYDLLFTGGGSKVFLQGYGEQNLKNIIKIKDEDKYYSNVHGYLAQLDLADEE